MDRNVLGVLWDMDGVLVDTREEHYQAWAATLAAFGLPFSRQAFQAVFGMKNDAAIAHLSSRRLPAEQVAEIDAGKERTFRQMIRGRLQLLPGVREWLTRFTRWGFPQAVVSSAPRANIDALLEEVDILEVFAAVVASDGLPSKPDPAIYLRAAELIGLPPGRCWVVEDAVWGVEGAQRAGMRCLAVATTHPAEALRGADLVVDRLSDLAPEAFVRLAGLQRRGGA